MANENINPGQQPQQPMQAEGAHSNNKTGFAEQNTTQPMQPQVAPVQPAAPIAQPVAPATPMSGPVGQPAPVAQPQVVRPQPAPTIQQRPLNQPVPPVGRPIGTPPLNAKKPPSARRLISMALGCFGCSLLLFVVFALIFVSQTSATGENAIAKSLGVDTGTFINSLITIVNLLFGFLSIIVFIVAIVGIFRTAMARKDDKEGKKKGLTLAGAAGLLLTVMILIWVGVYLMLSAKKVSAPQINTVTSIVTDPANTLGLTAPVTIKFDGTKLPLNTKKYEILSFLWDFGDGETSTVQSPSHNYTEKGKNNGRFDVKVTIALKDKTTGEETTQSFTDIVTIANVKLNAEFTATPDSGQAPLKVSFDASKSKAPAGEIQSYEWDFDNNNVFTDDTGSTVEHTFEQAGTYTVNLRVTDNTGQFAIASHDIVVGGPNLPTVVIDIPTTDGRYYTNTQYSFSGEKSTSPAGKITKYEWDFGDQTPKASTRTATHIYKTAGNYEVTLTATDEKGGKSDASKKITVETPVGALLPAFTTVPPQAQKNDGYITGTVPFDVAFDASSSTQSAGSIVDYKWDFDGDGTDDAAGKQVSYVYKTPGSYNATLTVYDAENKKASTVLIVKVNQQSLQARLSVDPVEGVVPLTVTFDASGSTYPAGKIVSYEWDFGDGGPKRIDVSKVTYKYSKIGTFTASVKAIASDNKTSTATTPVNVRPVPLQACFDASVTSGAAPLTIEFDPHCSTGTVAKYTWDFGDTQTSRTRKPTHTFTAPGSYQVTLEVADNQNVINSFTMDILVTGTVGG